MTSSLRLRLGGVALFSFLSLACGQHPDATDGGTAVTGGGSASSGGGQQTGGGAVATGGGGGGIAPFDAGEDDGGSPDSGAIDAGTSDAGALDAGEADAGGVDAGLCPSAPSQVIQVGSGATILRGVVVTENGPIDGEVMFSGDTITCVAPSCVAPANTTIIDTHGIILLGLIDPHGHVLFDIFDSTDWAPMQSYQNHTQFPVEPRYSALVDAKQYLNGEGTSPINLNCEMDKYGEIKALLGGTTSLVGSANPVNQVCYRSLTRTIDQTPNGLPDDKVQVATIFPTTSAADSVCSKFVDGSTDAYLIHVGWGVDQSSRNEFGTLQAVTTVGGCLLSPKTTIVHGSSFAAPEFALMAQHGMPLVWSPRSDVTLFGAGTDFSKTTNVPLARDAGVSISLGHDWSITGSQNLLDEMRFARRVDVSRWSGSLSSRDLFEMVTIHAARALGLSASLGSLAVGKKADVVVISGQTCSPYDALVAARPSDMKLIYVGGTLLAGEAAQKPVGCEDLDVCGSPKFICVALASGTSSDKLGQTLTTIQTSLSTAMTDYDSTSGSSFVFAPITPLVSCGL